MVAKTCAIYPSYSIQPKSNTIKEEQYKYVKHDQLFKHLILTYFKEFMEAFFPEIHEHIDFESIKPMSEELFTDLFEGEHRRADTVIEVKLKGKETMIIIHVEPQSPYEDDFAARMYLYFSLIYNRYRKPILPIALYSYNQKRAGQNKHVIEFPFLKVLTFNFLKVELSTMDWRSYLKSNNPVAGALLSKMNYSDKDKVNVKREFLRMMTKMKLSDSDAGFIVGFFERYLTLGKEEEEVLMEEIKLTDEAEEIMRLPISWEEKDKKKGIEQGMEKVAIELLKEEMPIDLIKKVTGFTKIRIKKLISDLQKNK